GGQDHEAEAAGRGRGIDDLDALAALAVARERLLGLPGRLGRAGEAAGDVDGDDVVARLEHRLEDRGEVAHRGLRRGRELLSRAQLLEERRIVGDVDLRNGPVAAEYDVQRDDREVVLLDQLRREVGGAVGHHSGGGHARGSLYGYSRRPCQGCWSPGPRASSGRTWPGYSPNAETRSRSASRRARRTPR